MIPSDFSRLKVALVHFWHVRRGGAERVLEVQAEMFPQADLFFLVANPATMAASLRSHRIHTSFLQHWPGSRQFHRFYLPLYPLALEAFDLTGYDLVISNEAGPAKGVITSPSTCHICYCHSPMRYAWEMTHEYRRGMPGGLVGRSLFALEAHYLRQWDLATAFRVDRFVANCENVAKRIRKYYRRECEVIYAPVAPIRASTPKVGTTSEGYYLVVSRLVAYKRVDLAIAACKRLQRRLLIIGGGEERRRLERLGGPGVEFLGELDDQEVWRYFANCRALLFCGEEDFGLTPLEAQASGRPVIAFGRGGALETVRGWRPGAGPASEATGIFFPEATVESLVAAIRQFESVEADWQPAYIREHIRQFEPDHFRRRFAELVAAQMQLPVAASAHV